MLIAANFMDVKVKSLNVCMLKVPAEISWTPPSSCLTLPNLPLCPGPRKSDCSCLPAGGDTQLSEPFHTWCLTLTRTHTPWTAVFRIRMRRTPDRQADSWLTGWALITCSRACGPSCTLTSHGSGKPVQEGLEGLLFKKRETLNWAQHSAASAAAAAKSSQSCLTLCNPTAGGPPGSPIPRILQARTLEWVAISFSNAWKWKWSSSVVSDSTQPHGL